MTFKDRVCHGDDTLEQCMSPYIMPWAEHVVRAPPTLQILQVLDERPTSPLGRPRISWEGSVTIKAGRLGIPGWRATG